MAKQFTAKELGLPKGFTFSEKNVGKVIVAAIRDKYGARVTEMIDRELQHHSNIYDYFYSREKREQYEAAERIFGSSGDNQGIWTYDTLEFYFSVAHMERLFPGVSAGYLEIDMVNSHSYRYSGKTTGLTRDKLYADDQFETSFSAAMINDFPRIGKLTPTDAAELLPDKCCKELILFYRECAEVISYLEGFKAKLKKIIAQYRSWVKLCNDSELFIPWIITASTWNDGYTVCSDIPIADDFAELDALIK